LIKPEKHGYNLLALKPVTGFKPFRIKELTASAGYCIYRILNERALLSPVILKESYGPAGVQVKPAVCDITWLAF
jgi:hypothetical protein